MTEHRSVKFDGGVVDVDNATFYGCTFSGTLLVFQATGPVEFENCAFEDVTLRFEGSAALTLSFLANVAGSGALRDMISRILADVLANKLQRSPRPGEEPHVGKPRRRRAVAEKKNPSLPLSSKRKR